jgi:hypothetical protein
MKPIWYAPAFTLAMLVLSATASGEVKIVNLSHRPVGLASYTYRPYSSQPDVTAAGWTFEGWYAIQPGEAFRGPDGSYYARSGNEAITFNNVAFSDGIAKPGRFRQFLSKNNFNNELRQAVDRLGYRKVRYMSLKGNYKINGEAYRIESRPFNFSKESRSTDFILETFRVPGYPIDYSYTADQRGASRISWKIAPNLNAVTLTGNVKGEQRRPFGPREPGYYKGRVTVYYTVRN